jgi:hypothetical protein
MVSKLGSRKRLVQSTDGGKRKAKPQASLIVVTFNSELCIQSCLDSVFAAGNNDLEVIVVDNDSSDGTTAVIEASFPNVKLIRAGANLGFSAGNNLGAGEAGGDVLVFINPDIVVSDNWLEPLISPLLDDEHIGLTTPKILLLRQPNTINTTGNYVHYTGFGVLRGWLAPADTLTVGGDVMSISGAAFAIRRSLYENLGGFDEAFFPAYAEDTDLSWRAHLLGYSCRYAPESIVYHDYTRQFSPNKIFWLERNRYQMLLKVLRWRTLILLLPAFFMAECISWSYAIVHGPAYLRAKWRSYTWTLINLRMILQRRRKVQATREVTDRAILRHCTYRMAFGQASDGVIAVAARLLFDPLFYVLHRMYLLVMNW